MNSLALGARRVGVPVIAALALFGTFSTAEADVIGPDFADMVEQVLPSVVHIEVEARQAGVTNPGQRGLPNPFGPGNPFNPFGPRGPQMDQRGNQPPTVMGSGSGFIIDPDGYVVTNNHVVDSAETVSVTLADGDVYSAEVVATDPSTDLALLKIDSDDVFPAVSWGDSDSLRIGNWVVAVGGPYGLSGSVTAGIVSATGRDLRAGPYDDYVQFDASINPGNSGGPVFNTSGEVVAISTAIVSPSRGSVGIGFAVPQSTAQPVIEALLENGTVERGFLGVQIQSVNDELAQALGLDEPIGALVAEVRPGSPAEQAGVQTGDLIVSFDGHKVDKMHDLPRLVSMTTPGSDVSMEVLRDGATVTLSVTVGELASGGQQASADTPSVGETVDRLGISVAAASDYGWEGANGETDGVVVTEVAGGSPADESGLQVGDVILAVGGRGVATPAEMAEIIGQHERDQDAMIALLVERNGDRRFIPLPLDAS